MILPKDSQLAIVLFMYMNFVIGSTILISSQPSASSSSEEIRESGFQQEHHALISGTVFDSSPSLLPLEKQRSIRNSALSKVSGRGVKKNIFKRSFYSRSRRNKRDSQNDGGETNDVTIDQTKDLEKMEREKGDKKPEEQDGVEKMETEKVGENLEEEKNPEKLVEKDAEKMAEEKGVETEKMGVNLGEGEKVAGKVEEEKVAEGERMEENKRDGDEGATETMEEGKEKKDEEYDYEYSDGKVEETPHSPPQITFDDSPTWPNIYPDCDPHQNPHTSPVDISTSDIVRVKGMQTLLVFSDQPKPDTYLFSTMHNSEGVRLEGFSIRLKDEDVVRDATYISGLGTNNHRFFDNALFFFRPLNENSTYSPLPPNRRAHTIDGKDFPMEIMFTFKTNLGEDLTQIHVMVEVTKKDNPVWRPILTMINPLIENVIHEKCFGAETARQQKDEMESSMKAYKEMISRQRKEMVGSTYRESYNELMELYGYVNSADEEKLMTLNTTLEDTRKKSETCEKLLEESTSKLPKLRKNVDFMKNNVQKSINKYKIQLTSRRPKPKEFNKPNNLTESFTKTKRELAEENSNSTTGDNHNDTKSVDDPEKNNTSAQVRKTEDNPANSSNQAATTARTDTSTQVRKTFEDNPSENTSQGPLTTNNETASQVKKAFADNQTSNTNQGATTTKNNGTFSHARKGFKGSSAKNTTQGTNTTKSNSDDPFKLKLDTLAEERKRIEKELQGKTNQLKVLTAQQIASKKCVESQAYLSLKTEHELQKLNTLRQYYKIGSTSGNLYPSVSALKEEMEKAKNKSEELESLKVAYQTAVLNYDSLVSQQQRSILLNDPFHISWLFPARGGHYFYNGSSPIPPCGKRHYVIVFEDRITISKAQLSLFHKFPASKQKGKNTWSELCTDEFETTEQKFAYVEGMEDMKNQVPEITPLGHRTVWYNPRNLQYKADDGVHMQSKKRRLKKGKLGKR